MLVNMGFWHTGYIDFHTSTEDHHGPFAEKPATFTCQTCDAHFATRRDLDVHLFEGHATSRPLLILRGRECGRSRLTITTETSPSDWAIRSSDRVTVNNARVAIDEAIRLLSAQRRGVVDIGLHNSGVEQKFEFEFALADNDDLEGVDSALQHFIEGGELSRRSIDDFIMRSHHFATASTYRSGIASYLYGVLTRERESEAGVNSAGSGAYEAKYDQAVARLGAFDRPPAEAICGIVAFHYNQFRRAMTKTRSRRVAEVALRFESMLNGTSWNTSDLTVSPNASLDHMLSDSVIEQIVTWSAIPLDGSATEATELISSIHSQRSSDAFKLHLIAAEHLRAAGDTAAARHEADQIRHARAAEGWYRNFRLRTQGEHSL